VLRRSLSPSLQHDGFCYRSGEPASVDADLQQKLPEMIAWGQVIVLHGG